MAIFRKLFKRFGKHVETTEDHEDSQLQTHYFKATYSQMYETVEGILKNNDHYRITSSSNEHGEIAVEIGSQQAFLVVSIISVKPFETAVDLNITTDRFSMTGDYFHLKKVIMELYKDIEQIHPFLGAGINRN